jgi:purine-binding chemotaxis protein CheW
MTGPGAEMSMTQPMTRGLEARANGPFEQFLTFRLAGEEYGVDILRVQEIRGWTTVTRIPNLPDYIEGMLNLRGTVVPIIDLRARFGIERIAHGPSTVFVVLKTVHAGTSRTVGLVVDGVSDVCNVYGDQLKPPPDLGDSVDTGFLKGVAALDDRMVILLEVDHLLDGSELAMIERVSRHTADASRQEN